MTPAEALKREAEEITRRTGYFIPPYRLAELMKTASKVTNLITNVYFVNYAEAMFILNVVEGAVKEAIGSGGDGHAETVGQTDA